MQEQHGTPERDARGRKPTCLCGTCPKCVHRTYKREYMRDYNQGIRRPTAARVWTTEHDSLLGMRPDKQVATELGVSLKAVQARRRKLGIERFNKPSRMTNEDGYVFVRLNPADPFVAMTRSDNYVAEHRLVMAQHLGRPLVRDEFVHHRNGLKHDNRIENLELWTRSHPDGQRVEDVLEWCVEFIERYARDTIFAGGNNH